MEMDPETLETLKAELAQIVKDNNAMREKVAALKANKAPQSEVDNGVKELKRLKTELERLNKLVNPAGENIFEAQREELEDLTKRRFFYRQAFDIYGGTAGFFSYGPPGSAVKTNLIDLWRRHFAIEENLFEIEDTCIMPYRVLEASGHVERFNDYMVKDTGDTSKFYRADKLLEERLEELMKEPDCTPAQRSEYQTAFNKADAHDSAESLHADLVKYGVKAPETGNDISEPYQFNLMYPVPIGPAGDQGGFLRPETAQGIFLNFKYCLEQNGGHIPFGICQVGKAFRNEIAPRGGLIRQREFTQAEIEYFVPPGDKPHSKFKNVAGLELELFPQFEQMNALPTVKTNLGEAVSKGKIANETLGYFIGRTYLFLERAGVRPAHIRFRQHLPTEMAHYACDCWDAEIEFSHGWVECIGIADRSAFDLDAHAKVSGTDLKATRNLPEPRIEEVCELSKKANGMVGKDFKADKAAVLGYLSGLDTAAALAMKEAGGGTVDINGKSFTLEAKHVDFTVTQKKISTESFTPNVIEPSFGIDRILCALFEHCYSCREIEDEKPTEDKKAKKGKGASQKEKMKRHVLSFKPDIAPFKCAVLPLMANTIRHEKYEEIYTGIAQGMNRLGVSTRTDESGVAIGKKYARHDELGIPFAITIDGTTFEDNTITLRERDSCRQVRMPIAVVADEVQKLCTNNKTWADIRASYQNVANEAEKAFTGNAEVAAAPVANAQQTTEAYITQHNLRAILQDAVNNVVSSQPADPIAALVAALAKK